MHVSYIYIFSFGVLKNIGLHFDHRFVFDMEDGVLRVRRNTDPLPEQFWGGGIYSMTAIVGNNGSGKTTALQLMKRLFVDGAPRHEGVDTVIVYEEEGVLYVYSPKDIIIESADDVEVRTTETRITIETFYYSSHFQPYVGSDDMELAGCYDGSDSWLLIKDLQDYSNVDTLHLSEPLYNHLLAYYAQNNYRICEVLMLPNLDEVLKSVRLPQFVQFAPNMGGWNAIRLDRMGRFEDIDIPGVRWTSRNPRELALEQLIFYDIINLIAEDKGDKKELENILKDWQLSDKGESVIASVKNMLNDNAMSNKTREALHSLVYTMERINGLCDFDEQTGIFYLDVKNGVERLRNLVENLIRSHYFLTAKFFDIFYSHDLTGTTRLSSGEQELLNLLSRLYYGISLLPFKCANKWSPRLLLLDEAEIGFHPEWQLQFVRVLTEFIHYLRVKAGIDFQIVITSHSPIILSDMPVSCVNFLRRDGNTTALVTNEQETFGENVFNLYRRVFFMNEGLVGAFAHDKIGKLVEDIENRRDVENLPKRIRMVGDQQIRNYLAMKYAGIDQRGAITLLEEQIQQIKNGAPWN